MSDYSSLETPKLEPADQQFFTYAAREADLATAECRQAKALFEEAAEKQRTKVNAIQEFSTYLTKKYQLTDDQDIDLDGNIINRT
jgi:hypothetical protein